MQYTRNDGPSPGTYRVRGDVIDIFPAESEREAVRVELFDDRSSARAVRSADRRGAAQACRASPSTPKHALRHAARAPARPSTRSRRSCARGSRSCARPNKLVEAQRLEQRTMFDLEMIQEVGYCAGIENYSRYLSGRQPGEPPPCLYDYLPTRRAADRRREPPDDSAARRHVQGRPLAQGDAGRVRLPPALGARQPAAALRGMGAARAADDLRLGDAGPVRARAGRRQVVEQVVRPTGLVDPEVEVRPVRTQVDDVLSEIRCASRGERVLVTTLTKRMAEDLTEYLARARRARCATCTPTSRPSSAVEIIRDLRLGKFDVLVGINLLREGLDMPEVSLVAILDADKEGFLRSERSLIQTIGRAARNLNGRAILYADRMTGSMQRAIDETSSMASWWAVATS
jgi:excinuclease ABC subunit B